MKLLKPKAVFFLLACSLRLLSCLLQFIVVAHSNDHQHDSFVFAINGTSAISFDYW